VAICHCLWRIIQTIPKRSAISVKIQMPSAHPHKENP
jgi:hypothetical protein